MSVNTTASECIDKVRENIEEAYKNILIVLNPDTSGNDEYKKEYIDDLHDVAVELLKIKRKI